MFRKKKKNEKLRKYINSLQFRMCLIFIIVGIVPIMLIKHGILTNYQDQAVKQRISIIQSQSDLITAQISKTDYLSGEKSKITDVELQQMANLYNGRILVVNKEFRIIKDTDQTDEGKYIVAEEVIRCFRGEDGQSYSRKNGFIEITIPIYDAQSKEVEGVMIVSTPTRDIRKNRDDLNRKVLILQIGMGIVIFLIAYYLSKMLAKPFEKVTKSLSQVQEGFLDADISIPDYTETQQLAEAYNQMLARMKALDDSRQEFVSNVSHELKTPITSMKVLADSLLAQPDAPVELYQEFMADIAEEIDRENKIITDLLSLVKMDKKAADLHIENKNINELLELIIKRLTPIADKQDINLVLESFRPVNAEVDETKLTLALSNLVENAIKYNKEGGWVHVSLNVDNKYFYVKVEDSGIGIPKESQDAIFERFYRVDKSHSREIGGTGLGLAITRSAILMHRGAIKVYSKEGEGTTFTVRIPLIYVN